MCCLGFVVRLLQCTLGSLLNKLKTRSVAEEVLGQYPAPQKGLLTEMRKIKSLDLLELQEEGTVRKRALKSSANGGGGGRVVQGQRLGSYGI